MEEETKDVQTVETITEPVKEEPAKAEPAEATYTQKQVDEMISEKLSEADKLRKMNAEQKAVYEREQLEKKLSEREAMVTARELKATAKETLTAKNLPSELAECLDYSSAENCSKSIEAVQKAFNIAVTNAVNERLRQNPPKSADGHNNSEKDPFLEGFGL